MTTFNHINAAEQVLLGSVITPLLADGTVTPVKLGKAAGAIIQDITYTAVNGGASGNNITIAYIEDGIAGSEIVNVSGTAITVHIGNHTILGSTATQVYNTILASVAASLLVTPVISGTSSNVQLATSAIHLTGGVTGATVVSSLTSSHIFVGNASNVATDVPMSGDTAISNTGVTTVGSVGGSSASNIHNAELAANAATNLNTPSAIVKRDGSGNFNTGTVNFSNAPIVPTVTYTASTGSPVTPDARTIVVYLVTVNANLTINGPSNGYSGQKILFQLQNDATHSVTFATGSGNFNFTPSVPSYIPTPNSTDYIGVVFNSSTNKWDIVASDQAISVVNSLKNGDVGTPRAGALELKAGTNVTITEPSLGVFQIASTGGGSSGTPAAYVQSSTSFTTASTTFVAITNMSRTFALSNATHRVKITFTGSQEQDSPPLSSVYTLFVDGSDVTGNTGYVLAQYTVQVGFTAVYPPGDTSSHTYAIAVRMGTTGSVTVPDGPLATLLVEEIV